MLSPFGSWFAPHKLLARRVVLVQQPLTAINFDDTPFERIRDLILDACALGWRQLGMKLSNGVQRLCDLRSRTVQPRFVLGSDGGSIPLQRRDLGVGLTAEV